MGSRYVPPHSRGTGGLVKEDTSTISSKPSGGAERGSDRWSGGDRWNAEDRGSSRFDCLNEDGPPPRGGRGGQNASDRGIKESVAHLDPSDIDWTRRADGRRPLAVEPSEVEVFGEPKGRSSAGIDFDKYDAIPVQVTGNAAADIVPISRFSEARLTDMLFENLQRCGYDRPTPIQKYSIPIVVKGRDLMACAQTGSGKTCAFMVPCLESLLRSGPPASNGGGRRPKPMPCALVLAPTRELAAQIHVESLKFSFRTGIRSCIVYGGAEMREQRNDIERGCDVLIATPGRLSDMYDRGYLSLALVQFFILDEADRMLDMGFEPQVRQIVSATDMGSKSRIRRQNMMFSATFAREVQSMARDFLDDYIFITVGRVGSASELVTQKVTYADNLEMKTRALEKVIKEYLTGDGLAVVFVETKRGADALERELYDKNVSVTAIHGDRTQAEREEALAAFKSGANPVMVATDVAARGLDISNVSLVVNFDLPKQIDDYVHRIGRTGRAGRKGVAVAFVDERCAYLPELYDLLSEAKQETPLWFEDLCRTARRPTKGKGREERSFGGRDVRELEGAKAADGLARPPSRGGAPSTLPAPRPASGFGNTGQDDAW